MLLIQQYNTHTHTSPVQESYILLATWDTPQRDYPQVSSQCRPTPAPPKNRGYNQGNASQLSLCPKTTQRSNVFLFFFLHLLDYLFIFLFIDTFFDPSESWRPPALIVCFIFVFFASFLWARLEPLTTKCCVHFCPPSRAAAVDRIHEWDEDESNVLCGRGWDSVWLSQTW